MLSTGSSVIETARSVMVCMRMHGNACTGTFVSSNVLTRARNLYRSMHIVRVRCLGIVSRNVVWSFNAVENMPVHQPRIESLK